MVARRIASWTFVRAVILGAGLPFVALSVGSACLDYAGEELMMPRCDSDAATTNTGAAASTGAGSGSGSGTLVPARPDCGTNAVTVGASAGSSNSP